MELEFGVTREVSAGGGVKFWVYNAEGEVGKASSHTQRLRLKLSVVSDEKKQVLINGTSDLPPKPVK